MSETPALRLAILIRELGMTDGEFAVATGIPKSSMSLYLSGKRMMKQDRISLIADKYGINPAWLMGYDAPMEKQIDETPELSDDERYVIKFRNALNSMDDEKKKLMKDNIDTMYKMLGIDPTNL